MLHEDKNQHPEQVNWGPWNGSYILEFDNLQRVPTAVLSTTNTDHTTGYQRWDGLPKQHASRVLDVLLDL